MPDLLQRASSAAQARSDAEAARLDAQLEIAAKKAALRSLESQAGGQAGAGGAADFPAPSAPPSGRIVIERDGNTIILDNPTAEQLEQAGVTAAQSAPQDWETVATVSSVMWSLVAVVWLVLRHRRRRAPAVTTQQSDEMAARMARIENAIESVAVEVERISEGQRFTTRLLSDGAAVRVSATNRGDVLASNQSGR